MADPHADDRPRARSDGARLRSRPRQGAAAAATAAGLAVVVLALAFAFPPIHHHYAGGDAADYLNNAFQRSYGLRSAEQFLPPDWPELDEHLVARAFTDARYLPAAEDGRWGLMTNFVRVFDGEVHIAHDDLTALVMAGGLELGIGQRAVAYLNYACLLGAALAMVLLCRALGASMIVAVGAGVVLALIPSQVMGARYPLSEALAQALWLWMAAALVRTRARSALAFLPLPLLVLARPEFAIVAAVVALWAGFTRRADVGLVALLVVSALASPSLSLLGGLGGPLVVPVAGALGYAARCALGLLSGSRGRPSPVRLGPVRPAAVVVLIAAGIVAAELVRRELSPGQSLGPIDHQRYSTLGLLVGSVGWPLLVLGVAGLVTQAEGLARRAPGVLLLMVVPQLAVFASMHASPPSVHFWTRRFHLVVFPLLIVGAAAGLSALVRRSERWAPPAALVAGAVAITVAALPIRHLDADAWRWTYVHQFHGDAAALPAGAVVLLPRNSPGLKAQLPMRTVHGLYSFVVFDEPAAREVVAQLGDVERPVIVEAGLADALELPVSASSTVVSVQVSAQEAYALDLRAGCGFGQGVDGCGSSSRSG